MIAAIRGCGKYSNILKTYIDKYLHDYKIKYYIEKDSRYWGKRIDEIEIISPAKAACLYRNESEEEWETIFIPSAFKLNKIEEIIDELNQYDVKKEDIFIPPIKFCKENNLVITNKTEFLINFDQLSQLYYVEYHVNDHCNLNCKGCTHFSPLVGQPIFVDYKEFEKHLFRLHEIVNHIDMIRILGGEPLLNKQLHLFIEYTRKLYPYSDLYLVTNGILLNQMTDKLIDCIKRNNIIVSISVYKPMWKKIDGIIGFLEKHDIRYQADGELTFGFTTSYNLYSNDDMVKKRKNCKATCVNLYNGKLSPCPLSTYTSYFNDYFQKSLPIDEKIDIYDTSLSVAALRRELKKPLKICQYCDISKKQAWNSDSNEYLISDWIVSDSHFI